MSHARYHPASRRQLTPQTHHIPDSRHPSDGFCSERTSQMTKNEPHGTPISSRLEKLYLAAWRKRPHVALHCWSSVSDWTVCWANEKASCQRRCSQSESHLLDFCDSWGEGVPFIQAVAGGGSEGWVLGSGLEVLTLLGPRSPKSRGCCHLHDDSTTWEWGSLPPSNVCDSAGILWPGASNKLLYKRWNLLKI